MVSCARCNHEYAAGNAFDVTCPKCESWIQLQDASQKQPSQHNGGGAP